MNPHSEDMTLTQSGSGSGSSKVTLSQEEDGKRGEEMEVEAMDDTSGGAEGGVGVGEERKSGSGPSGWFFKCTMRDPSEWKALRELKVEQVQRGSSLAGGAAVEGKGIKINVESQTGPELLSHEKSVVDKLKKKNAELKKKLGEREQRVKELETKVDDKDTRISEKDQRIMELEKKVDDRDFRISERDKRISELEEWKKRVEEWTCAALSPGIGPAVVAQSDLVLMLNKSISCESAISTLASSPEERESGDKETTGNVTDDEGMAGGNGEEVMQQEQWQVSAVTDYGAGGGEVFRGAEKVGAPFWCTECKHTFSNNEQLIEHMKKYGETHTFPCGKCSRVFSSKKGLSLHQAAIHPNVVGVKRFECEVCKKKFSRSHYVTVHRTLHEKSPEYACDKCEKLFGSRFHLKEHKIRTSCRDGA